MSNAQPTPKRFSVDDFLDMDPAEETISIVNKVLGPLGGYNFIMHKYPNYAGQRTVENETTYYFMSDYARLELIAANIHSERQLVMAVERDILDGNMKSKPVSYELPNGKIAKIRLVSKLDEDDIYVDAIVGKNLHPSIKRKSTLEEHSVGLIQGGTAPEEYGSKSKKYEAPPLRLITK